MIKRIFYFVRKILVLIKAKIISRGKISLGKNFCCGANLEIISRKGSKLTIGSNFLCRDNVLLSADEGGIIKIGENVFLNGNVNVISRDSVTIGDNCFIAQNVVIVDHDHDYKNNMHNFVTKKVIIGNNVWIGANCVILKGTKIGDNVVVAAGSILNGDISSNQLVYNERKLKYKNIGKELNTSNNVKSTK